MTKLAHIQGGNEKTRYAYSDVSRFVRDCLAGDDTSGPVKDEFGPVGYEEFVDESVSSLLRGISPLTYGAVLLSTNCLIQPAIADAVTAHEDDLRSYLFQGGCIILMPQEQAGFPPFIAREFELENQIRENRAPIKSVYIEDDDILVNYPHEVRSIWSDENMARFSARPLFRFAPRQVSQQKIAVVVAAETGEPLLMRSRTRTRQRLVLASTPFDWLGDSDLFRNVLSYAFNGKPEVLVLRVEEATVDERTTEDILVRLLASYAPVAEASFANDPGNSLVWLLRNVENIFTPWTKVREPLRALPLFDDLMRTGGLLVSLDFDTDAELSDMTVDAGNQFERELALEMSALLAADTSWAEDEETSPINRKSLITCHRFLQQRYGGQYFTPISTRKRNAILEEARRQRLLSDFGNHIAHVQCRALLGDERSACDKTLIELEAAYPVHDRERAVLLAGTRYLLDQSRSMSFIGDFLDGGGPGSTAELARFFDLLATLDSGGALRLNRDDRARLLAMATSRLPPIRDSNGWGSNEGTTNIVRGLAAACRQPGPPESAALLALADGAASIRASIERRPFDARPTHEAARVAEAVARVRAVLPSGVERLVPAAAQQVRAARAGTILRPAAVRSELARADQMGAGEIAGEHPVARIPLRLAEENRRLAETNRSLKEDEASAAVGRAVTFSALAALALVPVPASVFLFQRSSAAETLAVILAFGSLYAALAAIARWLHRRSLLPRFPWIARVIRTREPD